MASVTSAPRRVRSLLANEGTLSLGVFRMSGGLSMTAPASSADEWFMAAGRLVSRYGLVVVLIWIGAGKYVKMESRVLIQHSPLMSWLYDFLSFEEVAVLLGTMEIVAAVLIAVYPLWPRLSVGGSALAVVLFLGTLSFLFTTPGVIGSFAGGFPVLSAQPGQFLLKDLVLIGVALWTLGESLEAARARSANNVPRPNQPVRP
ncbi:YkgB family protein [Saccharopolyspora sp. K220]|uniref:YkgB family protein n=1 Tax=Saccharopolyspora soli TaxID=2926618 RepID=UPI001F5A7C24|nr:DUF417 family protein [Saccharopolyspora soli]MCI2418251.1 YkgB family protein [Saccharopolyspora soli]